MLTYLAIIITAIFVNNIVFAQFLGICPFIGVSKNLDSALGMGAAVTFVMAVATCVTTLLWQTVMVPLGLEYVQTIVFILVIAILVQMLEIVIRKISPSLYAALGVFLPLITTNCAVLGVAIIVTQKDMDLLTSLVYAISTAIGFTHGAGAVCRHPHPPGAHRCAGTDARRAGGAHSRRTARHGIHGVCRHTDRMTDDTKLLQL